MKKLIAAAVAAAVIVPATAMAGSTLYGKIHMSVSYIDSDANTGVTNYEEVNVASHSSRIGVKGSEDLGNGMKLGYLMEWSVGMDGGGDLGQRNRYVTLGGGFGTALFGKVDTPMKTLGRKVDLFGERAADTRTLTRATSAMDNRQNNVIAYVTPNLSGLSATLAYVTDVTSATGDNNDTDAFSANAIYSNGPLLIGGAYTQVAGETWDTATTKGKNERDYRLAGSYKMGAFKVVGSYTDTGSGGGVSKNDYSVWQLGGAFDFGSNTIKAQYSDKSEGVKKSKDGAAVWAIGFEHKMSKRTMVYVDYGMVNNDKGSAIAITPGYIGNGNGAPSGGSGSDPYTVGLGDRKSVV